MTKLATIKKLIPSEADDKIQQGLKTIDKKLKALGFDTNYTWKCGSMTILHPFNVGTTFNIIGINDINLLLNLLVFFKNQNELITKEMSNYQINTQKACWYNNIPCENIISDIDFKLKSLINASKITELNKAKGELSGFMSADSRLLNTLNNLNELLK